MRYFNKILLFLIFLILALTEFAKADSTNVSFQKLNKGKKYTSFSFGMGALYCNNPNLMKYIEQEIPIYNTLTRDQQLSEYYTGLEFFGGIERQINRNFSVKTEYSFFIKSYNVNAYPAYDFSYTSHIPGISLFYIIPQEYSYIKIGAGADYILSSLIVKKYGTEKKYTSNGFGMKGEIIFNAQIGKSFAGYISGYLTNTFLNNFKDNDGKELLTNVTSEKVNLNSFGAGIKLGVEIFLF
jgi:hypothetical protein